MADNASINWTGDTTFTIVYELTSQSFFITTLFRNFDIANQRGSCLIAGHDESTGKVSFQNIYGQCILRDSSSSWVEGNVELAGISGYCPIYIENVYILFGTGVETRKRGYEIVSAFNASQTVSAVNSYIESATWSHIFTRSQATPLSTPTGLYADNITSDSATIGWNAVENATDYKVEYRRQGDTTWNE